MWGWSPGMCLRQCHKQCADIWRGSAWIRTHLTYIRSERRCCETYGCICDLYVKKRPSRMRFPQLRCCSPPRDTLDCSATSFLFPLSKTTLSEAGVTADSSSCKNTFPVPGKSSCFLHSSASSLPQQPRYPLLWRECSDGANAWSSIWFFLSKCSGVWFFKRIPAGYNSD